MRNLKRALSLTLASIMLLGMMVIGTSAAGYPDVDDSHNVEAIEVLQAVGAMSGSNSGNFNPDAKVSRVEMAIVMANLLDLKVDYFAGQNHFTDVPAWAGNYVAACEANGIISGVGGDNFGTGNVTATQAALMMMKALGYFQYASDFGTDWARATANQAARIRLFDGIDVANNTQLTRNQVAQLALNALKSAVVEPEDNTLHITTPDGTTAVGGNINYVVVTSNRPFASAIDDAEFSGSSLSGIQGKVVELGEQLYNGKLKLMDNASDDFGRPARSWEYDGKDIGTYAKYELLRDEYTTAVNGKTLFELLGKFVIENNDVEYYWNGASNNTIEAKTMVKANTKDYATTGKGVLTQVFFEAGAKETDGQITIVSIDTFLAKATGDYNSKKESLSVDIYADDSTRSSVGSDTEIKLDEIPAIEGVKKDDKFLVQVAWNGTGFQIVKMLDTEALTDIKLNKYSENSYLANADSQYDYALNGKLVDSLNEIKNYNNKALVDYTYDLYLDQYGYLIGNAIHSGTDNYVFIAGYDLAGSHLATAPATASAIFLDGTMQNIQIAVSDTNDNINAYNTKADTGAKFYPPLGNTDDGLDQYNAWFTYTTETKNGATLYTLTPAKNWMEIEAPTDATPQKIRTSNMVLKQTFGLKGNTAAVKGTAGTRAYGNDDSVYVTVDTGIVSKGGAKKGITKITGTYTGVQNVDLNLWTTDSADNDTKNVLSPKTDTTHNGTDGFGAANAKISGVFAVYDDDLYIIGAVVVGEDNTNSNDYAYVLKKVKNEYIDEDNNHYWDFDAVVDGQIKTLTAKVSSGKYASMSLVFTSLCGTVGSNGLARVTYDKDGYVTNLVQMVDSAAGGSDKVYGQKDYTVDINPDIHKIYTVKYDATNATDNGEPLKGSFIEIGRSLYNDNAVYNKAGSFDAGLPLATGAPVVVVREEKYTGGGTKVVYEDYTTIEQALSALDTHNGTFEGWVSAVLDDRGAAKFIVINDKNQYTITNDDGPDGGNSLIAGAPEIVTGLTSSVPNDAIWGSMIKSLDDGLYQSDYKKSTWAAGVDPDDVLLVKFTTPVGGTSTTLTIRDSKNTIWYVETQATTASTPYFFSVHVDNGVGHYDAAAGGKLTTDGTLPRGTYTASLSSGSYQDSWTFTID